MKKLNGFLHLNSGDNNYIFYLYIYLYIYKGGEANSETWRISYYIVIRFNSIAAVFYFASFTFFLFNIIYKIQCQSLIFLLKNIYTLLVLMRKNNSCIFYFIFIFNYIHLYIFICMYIEQSDRCEYIKYI